MLKDEDRIILTSPLQRGNKDLEIHPASIARFPAFLPIGSIGEVVENKHGQLFLRFMLRPPGRWEQEFLKDNTVYVTVPLSYSWQIKKL